MANAAQRVTSSVLYSRPAFLVDPIVPIVITSLIALSARTIIRFPMANAVQSVSITTQALSLVKAVLLTAIPVMDPRIALTVQTTTLSRITCATNVETVLTLIQLLHHARSV